MAKKKGKKTTPNMSLRNARIAKGWTQKELAEKVAEEFDNQVKVDEQKIGRWERGEFSLSLSHSRALQSIWEERRRARASLGVLSSITGKPNT